MISPAQRGFTLIELLAVMAILAMLIAGLAVAFTKYQVRAQEREVEALLVQYSFLIEGEYEIAKGDYPPDDFAGLGSNPANDLNSGIESMVAALAGPTATWPPIEEKHLGNTDGDKFPKLVTSYASNEAFELVDRWGNPVVYFHCKSYGKRVKALAKALDGMGFEEQLVEAVKSEKTGQFLRPTSFQLISAGRDGVFGTPDDLLNAER